MKLTNKYCEYFDIDERYFPCIDDEAIRAGAPWENTYPHDTFIALLNNVQKMLSGHTKRSIWIHGSYGTGKSQCAYALKKILEVPEAELRGYWSRYKDLQKSPNLDLLEKLIGQKSRKIVTAFRYASGSIDSTRELLRAVQETIRTALEEQNVDYLGEDTLKDSIIAWIEDPFHKEFLDSLLKTSKYSCRFSQSNADEILNALHKGGELKELVGNIFYLAEEEGITAMNINTDRLISWLKDVIAKNHIKIVLIWDEFSDYFKKNRDSLGEFQKLVTLCEGTPFYFIIVTHQTGSIITNVDQGWSVVKQRFDFSEITLPDNIAFDLISHAFSKKPAANENWNAISDDLYRSVPNSTKAVKTAAGLTDVKAVKDILPIHPYAAMILKNIAQAFEANQRSMFDFIKTAKDDDVKAFQWFISNTTPDDERPFLTVDLLWNFFYERGRNNLTPDIQLILDTFPRQQNLSSKEQSVLKAILTIQAIDQRLGSSIELFHVTEKNLAYAFEGIRDLEGHAAIGIAKKLVDEGILYKRPIGNNQEVFAMAALAGDQAKIDKYKENIRENATTTKLVAEGGLETTLPLSAALKLRFGWEGTEKIRTVTLSDFTKTMNEPRYKHSKDGFNAVMALAKDDNEVIPLRKAIASTLADEEYKGIIIIDALSTPLGIDAFEQYVDFSAMAAYYVSNDKALSADNANKARRILDSGWKNRIINGQIIIYSDREPNGERHSNMQGVLSSLASTVKEKYPFVFDFSKGVTDPMLSVSELAASSKCGIIQITKGRVSNIEKQILPNVWKTDSYWESQPTLPISKIKIRLEKRIREAFSDVGHISIREICDLLKDEFGFVPCNLSSFLTGFLLKEYSGEPYHYGDSQNKHEPMSPDKLAEMIGTYTKTLNLAKYKDTYIVEMTSHEQIFFDLTKKSFGLEQETCLSVGQMIQEIRAKIRDIGLPIWCLSEVDTYGHFEFIEKYMELIQKEGKDAHLKAIEIGRAAEQKSTLGDNLAFLISNENCQKGMNEFLKRFENGRILELADKIGAGSGLLDDIRKLFNVKYFCNWNKDLGENEIRKLLTNYGIVLESNILLKTRSNSLSKTLSDWRDKMKFVFISPEQIEMKYPSLTKLVDSLRKIVLGQELLPEQLKDFHNELVAHGSVFSDLLAKEKSIFGEVYSAYLDGFCDEEIREIRSKLPQGMFCLCASECNEEVKLQTELFRQRQTKTKLHSLWKDNTGTRDPREWSSTYEVPIFCLVPEKEFDKAKKAFDTINRINSTEKEVEEALEYLQNTQLFADLKDEEKREKAFVQIFIGEFSDVLHDTKKVQNELKRLSIDPYDWYENPLVKKVIRSHAEREYLRGGCKKALELIEKMSDDTLRKYLREIIQRNMAVGIEIMRHEGANDD